MLHFNYFLALSIILFTLNNSTFSKKIGDKTIRETSHNGPIPIVIKDSGIVDLKKGDVAMVFYMTATNTGLDSVHLFVNGTQCCQKITPIDEDCDSMKLFGGNMGELYPQDTRNLTVIYANLNLHNRIGSCVMEITNKAGDKMMKEVNFDTTLIQANGSRIPRVLENYYNPDDLMTCDSVDEDPLNLCHPYSCFIRYDGTRNFYNHTSKRCEKLPNCLAQANGDDASVAYISETNTCKSLLNGMTPEELSEFKEGKPSMTLLTHAHSYPINVNCHNGKRDPKGHWCTCNPGWESAPFDHAHFNPDVQLYHMCTVWTGEMSAEEARNITIMPKDEYRITNVVVFSVLGVSFFLLCVLVTFLYYRQRMAKKREYSQDVDDSEVMRLTEIPSESDYES